MKAGPAGQGDQPQAHGEAPQDPNGAMPTEDHADSTALEKAQETVPETVHSQKRLTQADQFKIMRWCLVDKLPQKTAAEALGFSEATISRFLSQIEDKEDYARTILEAATPDAAIRWAEIAKTSKNHLAAKELLLHTGKIKPLEGESGGAKVQILIGQPGAPVTIASPQAVDAVVVSSDSDDSTK